MIELIEGTVRFNYRVAGVCMREDHVLLHREETYDFWALPGGRLNLLESSTDALVREMDEEMSLHVEAGPLLWCVENFFEFADQRFHELGMYFLMTLPERASQNDVRFDFMGFEGKNPIVFRWFPIDGLEKVPLFPTFLRSALADLPSHPVHIIHTDLSGD